MLSFVIFTPNRCKTLIVDKQSLLGGKFKIVVLPLLIALMIIERVAIDLSPKKEISPKNEEEGLTRNDLIYFFSTTLSPSLTLLPRPLVKKSAAAIESWTFSTLTSPIFSSLR